MAVRKASPGKMLTVWLIALMALAFLLMWLFLPTLANP
jgi:hypothetical protein